jgi:uncharacterized protein (TIGR02246 family)
MNRSSAVIVSIAVSTLAACAGSNAAPHAPAVSAASPAQPTAVAGASDRRLATLDAIVAAAAQKDAHGIAALYADGAVVERFGGRTLHGRDEIETAVRAEMAPAASVRAAFGRVWLQGDLAVAEAVYQASLPPGGKVAQIGATELDFMWFDAQGRIVKEHDYVNQTGVAMQMRAMPGAPDVPQIPASREVHVAAAPAPDAATVAWTNAYEKANSTDAPSTLAYFDDGLSWSCTLGFTGHSKAEFTPKLEEWFAAFPDMTWTPTTIVAADDFVVVEETMSGTQKGKLGPFEATGRHVDWHWAEVWQTKNGKVTSGWSYANFDEALPQIGAPSIAVEGTPCSIQP